MPSAFRAGIPVLLVIFSVFLTGCQSTYYSAMEKVGVYKREILVDRIESSQAAQEEAQEQFSSALEQFRSVVNFNGGDLEALYDQLNTDYEDSVASADEVRKRIQAVKDVSEALFEEWEEELELYSSAGLRRASQLQLNETRHQYKKNAGQRGTIRKTHATGSECLPGSGFVSETQPQCTGYCGTQGPIWCH